MIFNYLFENINQIIYNITIMNYYIDLTKHIDFNHYEDIKSFLHSIRNLIELIDENNCKEIFNDKQINHLLSIMDSLKNLIYKEDKDGYNYIYEQLELFNQIIANKTNPNFLF